MPLTPIRPGRTYMKSVATLRPSGIMEYMMDALMTPTISMPVMLILMFMSTPTAQTEREIISTLTRTTWVDTGGKRPTARKGQSVDEATA